ncbi:hypothetical protein [Haliscomenobacter hydrossis]|uniref:FecR protein domain-containing protein n=1 Tax=Haliscomenobacter hydrossis (strain ATCC 27775 / DSM 1100 / LMG 10767 / O) TaxID=760192 RepID=F4KSM8_HALH1|nr:hypothetical protein [Haliscomenobacter hydrossis]AEE47992.1 hypothetical protein Halhy_0079 [Haliscomenobacter hydrossis DSM 1100]
MGNNYNIKHNVPEPSSEDIAKFMDFDALLEAHRKIESSQEGGVIRQFTSPREGQIGPRMRRWMVMGAGLAAAAAVALLLIVRSLNDLPTPAQSLAVADAYFAKQPYVNPPLTKVVPAGRPIKVDVAAGATLDLDEGTRLVIPRTAFQTDRGQLIESGEVDIYYREMHDAVDFFVAGVPMSYDSAGTRHYLQSAGMVEIIALQNGQPVGMAPGKTIRIELQSSISAQADGSWPSFKVYHLDATARSWVFHGKSSMLFEEEPQVLITPGMSLEQKINAEKEAILAADPMPQAPAKPVKPDGKSVSFELDLKDGELPLEPGSEEAVASLQEGAIWQVLPNSPAFNVNALNQVWKSARLKRLSETAYELTLLDDGEQLRLLVQPVITGKEFENALQQYDEALAAYQKELADWEKRTGEKITAVEARYLKTEETNANPAPSLRRVRHVFDINAFGIWNCDSPAPLSSNSFRIRVIEDQNGNTYPNQTAYLSDQSGQSIYQLHTGRGSTVYFDSQKEYLLWLLTPEGKIALVKTKAEWAKSNPKKGVKLKVQTINHTIRNEADIRRALNPD